MDPFGTDTMKKTADEWFTEYAESHQNRFNKLVHWICVPAIAASIAGLLWAVPMPPALRDVSPLINLATIAIAISMAFYFRLSIPLAVGMLAFWMTVVAIIAAYGQRAGDGSVLVASVILFVVAWIGQFIGHSVEGKKPSFFQDLQFLLIGPAWLLHFIYRRLNIRY